MKCQNCGVENPEKNKFCMNCGTTIVNVPSSTNVEINRSNVKKKSNSLTLIVALIMIALIVCVTFLVFSIVKSKTNNSYNIEYKGYKKVGSDTLGYAYIPEKWNKLDIPSDEGNTRYIDGENVLMYADSSNMASYTIIRYNPEDVEEDFMDIDSLKKGLEYLNANDMMTAENTTISGRRAVKLTYKYGNLYNVTFLFKDNKGYGYQVDVSANSRAVMNRVIDSYTFD